MPIKLPLLAVLLCFIISVHAQSPITLTDADMPTAGNTLQTAKDTPVTTVNYGLAGANQVYDFSALTNTITETANYAAPTGSQTAAFPGANLTVQSTTSSTFLILNSSASAYNVIGAQGTVFGQFTNSTFSPPESVYEFPVTYQSSFYSKWGFYAAFTGTQVGQGAVDSVREIYTDNFSVTVDGWGKVITPVGSYRALRLKRVDTTVTKIQYEISSFLGWSNVSGYPLTEHTTEYSYVAKETKGTVVSFTYDSAGDMLSAQYSLIPPLPPVAGFSYVTGATGLVTFTDTSEGYPTTYHWSFGDGDTSNVADPTHTYAANGTYYVCETVSNANGSNTVCDSVHITDITVHVPPVANNDSATVQQPNSATLNVTSNDYSPSNDSFCITTVYGGSFFSQLNCNNISFNPGPTFTGYDTCYYVICNTNEPTMCDTARVIVDVISDTVHVPPVAVNDTAIDLEGHTDVINATGNDFSPSNDPFCITVVYGSSYFTVTGCNDLTFTPPTNFTGYDTAWYIICNTGEPTLCDTASVIVDVINTHLPPVAVNYTGSILQPNAGAFNVVTHDYSPSNDSFCITQVYGSSYFSVANCDSVLFNPDSTGGSDTAWYIICNIDEPTMCDTASIIITVTPNPALLPNTNFTVSNNMCEGVAAVNTTINIDSLLWNFSPIDNVFYADSSFSNQNTAQYGFKTNGLYLQVCLTSYNRFGNSTKCDTLLTACTTGIDELTLAGIYIYPNPASSRLTIDMRGNTSAVIKNYTAIEIYDAIGHRVEVLGRADAQADVVNVAVGQLPAGIYMAAIVDGTGTRTALGKFIVMQ